MSNNEKGFTLVESLLTLSVFILITTLLPLFIQSFHVQAVKKKDMNPYEWEVFLQQTQMELRESSTVSVEGNTLVFRNREGQKVTYSKYKDMIRRQVSSQGHEVLVQNVYAVSYILEKDAIVVTVTDMNKVVHSRLLTHFGSVDGGAG